MDFTLIGLWSQMGFIAKAVVTILLGMSMWAIGISLERFITFKKGRERSLAFIGALQPYLEPAGNLDEAASLETTWSDAPLARILMTGLKEFRQGLAELGASATDSVELELMVHAVARTMDRAKKREMAALSKGLPVLATVASSAPFVGLFGTVFGIITAFQLMADPSAGGGGLATVSAGIAEALLTTAVGLGVAIGAVWCFNFFTTKMDQMGGLVDDATGELVDRLAQKTRIANLGGGAPPVAAPPQATAPAPAAAPAPLTASAIAAAPAAPPPLAAPAPLSHPPAFRAPPPLSQPPKPGQG